MKKILLFICFFWILCGCVHKDYSKMSLDEIIEENNYVIVDVRTKEEYNSGHVVGAVNIPYDEVSNAELDKSKVIIVYCKSGARSKAAATTLKSLHYDVYDLGAYDLIHLDKI